MSSTSFPLHDPTKPKRPRHLNFITSNANKLAEVRAILGDVVELQSNNVEVPELQGGVVEIAVAKARSAADKVSPEECPLFLTLCWFVLVAIVVRKCIEQIGLCHARFDATKVTCNSMCEACRYKAGKSTFALPTMASVESWVI